MDDTVGYFSPSEQRTICLRFDPLSKARERHLEEMHKFDIWVSKELLAMASPVFRRMFYGKKQCPEPIHLPGKSLDDFLILLQCLSPNFDRKEVDQTNVRIIYPLADEYQMELLITKCIRCFEEGLREIPFGDPAILDDVVFFIKHGLIFIVENIIQYVAALDVGEIDDYRERNKENLPIDHRFYFAVFEAKACSSFHVSLRLDDHRFNYYANR